MSELKKIESPGEHIATFETDELTAFCPFDFGGPDFYTLKLKYTPSEYIIESKSLKEYFATYRDEEITAEALGVQIHEDILDTISPKECYVCLEQSRRGGIEEKVEVGDCDLS